jgi:hypothetical protein
VLSSESELRVRSYGCFHRIYEQVELGMPPTAQYPRRSRIAPTWMETRPSREKSRKRPDHIFVVLPEQETEMNPIPSFDYTDPAKGRQTITILGFSRVSTS